MTYYLKYRPQTLEDLDQEGPRESLQKLIEKGDIPHAILLSGPKGTGKTSAARILAKIVNCERNSLLQSDYRLKQGKNKDSSSQSSLDNKQSFDPCNKCDMCKSITKGDNIDVIELDAASHRGIEDIRVIRDGVKLSPARAKKKVYIIDEAHMLTTEASNALLKTLEEPPSHVMFILATTNPEKLIDTIRSRTSNIYFKKATVLELANSLEKIAKGEEIKYEKGVMEIIANKSDGSFRDATKIFEQIVAETKDLTIINVEKLLTNKKVFDLDEFIKTLTKRDVVKVLNIIQESVENGAQVKDLTFSVIERLRQILLSKVGIGESFDLNLSELDCVKLTKLFSEAYTKIGLSAIEQLPVELAVIEYCGSIKDTSDKKQNIDKAKELEEKSDKIEPVKSIKTEASEDKVTTENMSETSDVVITESSSIVGQPFKSEIWQQVLALLRPSHASTEALLRAAKPMDFDGSVLKLGVYYKFHKEHLESNSHRTVLEEALSSFLGGKVKVVCILTEPPINPIANSFSNTGGGVVLAESNSVLTGGDQHDIINLAEKIFNQ